MYFQMLKTQAQALFMTQEEIIFDINTVLSVLLFKNTKILDIN